MTRYAKVENGVVVNILVADEDFATENGLIESKGAGIGWTYNGKTFTAPPEPEPEVVIPNSVSAFQAKEALIDAGVMDQVEQVIAQADDRTKRAWSNALYFERQSPTINTLAKAIGWEDAKLDELFIAAAKIKV